MKPNLFEFATSELSNDAILSWILKWGKYKNSELYQLSNDFIKILLDLDVEVKSVEIKLEFKNIDIVAIINEKYIIAIEDKIDTKEHSNQLLRYKDVLVEEFGGNYDEDNFRYVYVKIGDESSYEYIYEKGYSVIIRKDILKLLSNYVGKSDILDDYYDYLLRIEEEFNSHRDIKEIEKWSGRSWQGFYTEIKEDRNLENSNWGYVNNPRGGFWGFWWDIYSLSYKDIECLIYLQIEESRIVFKVQVEEKDYQSEIRNHVWNILKNILEDNNMYNKSAFKTNFQRGKSMTIAESNDLETKEDIINGMDLFEDINKELVKILSKK